MQITLEVPDNSLSITRESPDEFARSLRIAAAVKWYPHLSLAEIHSALAYYFDHQDQIDTEIREELQRAKQGAAESSQSPLAIRLAELAC